MLVSLADGRRNLQLQFGRKKIQNFGHTFSREYKNKITLTQRPTTFPGREKYESIEGHICREAIKHKDLFVRYHYFYATEVLWVEYIKLLK